MKANNGIGAKKPTDMDEISAIKTINIGKIAPPTIAMTINDAHFFVFSPRSLMPRAKIVGNMIDMKKKIRNNAIIETHPKLKLTIGNNRQHISE